MSEIITKNIISLIVEDFPINSRLFANPNRKNVKNKITEADLTIINKISKGDPESTVIGIRLLLRINETARHAAANK